MSTHYNEAMTSEQVDQENLKQVFWLLELNVHNEHSDLTGEASTSPKDLDTVSGEITENKRETQETHEGNDERVGCSVVSNPGVM